MKKTALDRFKNHATGSAKNEQACFLHIFLKGLKKAYFMKNAKLPFDKQADAICIAIGKMQPGIVKQTLPLKEDILIDFDADKKIIGIEILNASKNLPESRLKVLEAIA